MNLGVIREAVASARSGPVASLLTILVVAGVITMVMLTTGRTVGAEQEVLGSIDSAGTRSILVSAEGGSGITASVLGRIANIKGIEWAGAFSSAMDATNSAVNDGVRTPVRYAYGSHLDRLGVPRGQAIPGDVAYASSLALQDLGLPDVAGSITLIDGRQYAVVGRLRPPDFLADFEPFALIPRPNFTGDEPVAVIVVIAARPDLVAPVRDAVLSVLAPTDVSKVTVQTSEELATLRALIQGQLGTFSRSLVLAVLGIGGALVATILYGLVMLRRKDFGRRRALGATRGLIVALLLVQTGLLAIVGAALGLLTATLVLIFSGDPLPGVAFAGAVVVLALTVTLISAIVPALIASHREPIHELRVP